MKKWFIEKRAYILGLLSQKTQDNLNKKDYEKAFQYLNWREKFHTLVGSKSPSPIPKILRLELNFLTHNYEEVIKNIDIPIKAIEETKLEWSQKDRGYLKAYCYNFVLLTYTLLDDGNKMLEWAKIFNEALERDVDPKIVGYFPPYTKEKLQKLFESEEYYAKNYSEEIIGNVYELSEHIWG